MILESFEVPRETWADFFVAFSRRHDGWLITLDADIAPGARAREVHELPLDGVTFERNTNTICISVREPNGGVLTHVVTSPARVKVHETVEHALKAVEIRGADGRTTKLSFRAAVPTEAVDGVSEPHGRSHAV